MGQWQLAAVTGAISAGAGARKAILARVWNPRRKCLFLPGAVRGWCGALLPRFGPGAWGRHPPRGFMGGMGARLRTASEGPFLVGDGGQLLQAEHTTGAGAYPAIARPELVRSEQHNAASAEQETASWLRSRTPDLIRGFSPLGQGRRDSALAASYRHRLRCGCIWGVDRRGRASG